MNSLFSRHSPGFATSISTPSQTPKHYKSMKFTTSSVSDFSAQINISHLAGMGIKLLVAMTSCVARSHRTYKKYLLAMNLTAILITVFALQVSARTFSQKVTITGNQMSLRSIFESIEKQTGFQFVYSSEKIKNARPVNIKFENADVKEVLDYALRDQQLEYTLSEKIIVIKPLTIRSLNHGLFFDEVSRQDTPPVSGIVKGIDGQPISGANIIIKGTKRGTTTSADGSFTIDAVNGETIIISSIGFNEKQITIGENNISIISLNVSESKLDEVQIVAYGTTSQRISTGNVITVKAKDIEKQPVNNPLLALQGRVPGLFITQATGYAGTGVTVRIQGQNSINNGNDPLYVVDGIPFSSQLMPTINTASNTIGNSGTPTNQYARPISGNPFSFINPGDIESIDILKDADATAIYGSRAANGAILITTKKGKEGKTDVGINIQTGIGKVASKIDMLNTEQYLEMRREALSNDGIAAPSSTDYDLNGHWSLTKNTDWQKVLIGNTAHYTDVQATVSGGSKITQFFIGAGYKKQTSVLPVNISDRKASLHYNLNAGSNNGKFKIQLSGTFLYDDNRLPLADITYAATRLAPNAPDIYNPDGSINWAVNTAGSSTWGFDGNPAALLTRRHKNITSNLFNNLTISYEPVKGVELKMTGGFNRLHSKEQIGYPLSSRPPELKPYVQRLASFGDSDNDSWIIEPQARFKKSFGKLNTELLIGGTVQNNVNSANKFTGSGYTSDELMGDLITAASVKLDYSMATSYRYAAGFGRLNFNWLDKYILNFTTRRDGTSRFGSENLLHNFGSIGAAWVFSNKEFFKQHLSFISFGKTRASYGTTGSDQIGDFKFLNLYTPVPVMAYQGVAGILPDALPNPYLQWEETKKLLIGIDLGFLHDRILFTANYFRNNSSNQLLEYNLPITSGFYSITSNFPANIRNSGLELSVNIISVKSSTLKWMTNLNFTVSKNKLVKFDNLESSSYAGKLIIGEPLSIIKALKFSGVNPVTGIYQFNDRNGNLTALPDLLVDNFIRVNTDPKFYGGFQNTISYKQFSLDFTFQFVKQIGSNYLFGALPGYFPMSGGNQPVYVLDRWQKTGDIKPIQRFDSKSTLLQQSQRAASSDAAFSDASYIRLKNASISWNLPNAWKDNVNIKDAQLYLQAQNLLTFTKYKGLDPETRSTTTLPPLRIITAGIKLTL
jgi:TonB-dependent starch-binding outer membrane protein SusC